MSTREETLSLQLSSSEDESHSLPQYRVGALPKLKIPSPFQYEESSLYLDTGSGGETPSKPGTPTTPLSPIGSEFSHLAVSSQTSEGGDFATSRPRKKRFSK